MIGSNERGLGGKSEEQDMHAKKSRMPAQCFARLISS
jgi:hypothetical protein